MKFLKWFAGIVLGLVLLFFLAGMPYLRNQTKKYSPEKTAVYTQENFDLLVTYCSPFKKGRQIFGNLVPFDKVWRTGANEPTTFETDTDIRIIDKTLKAGTYSLWTIPHKEHWTIIFNREIPDWGVTLFSGGEQTTREPEDDALQVNVPVKKLQEDLESFIINFDKIEQQLFLTLAWDDTQINVPINPNH